MSFSERKTMSGVCADEGAVCECRVLISKRETGTETITNVGETTEVADVFIRSCLNRAVRTRLSSDRAVVMCFFRQKKMRQITKCDEIT